MGTSRLEVEELFRVDVREAAGLPRLCEEARRQRGALRSVVPAAECGNENRAAQGGAALHAEVSADGSESKADAAEI
jgi:hypothetical protein